jgi:hypothetical protein
MSLLIRETLRAVIMNSCIRIVCVLISSLIATHALSQDMSGWSDKTVCRLAQAQQDSVEYQFEMKQRGLNCGGNGTKNSITYSKHEEPLPEIADEKGYVVVLKEDFSKPFKYKKIKKNIYKYEYFMPNEPFWKAFRDSMKIENGQMTITIKPGTRQWDGDERNGTERAEWGFYLVNEDKLISREKYIKVSYEFKLPEDSKKLYQNQRTLIFQLKHDGGKYPGFSPASAFYVHKGGAATCVDYNNQRDNKSSQIQNHTNIRETNIYDGEWHKVEIILKLGKKDGYCLVTIDEEKIIEKINYDNDLNPNEQLVAKIGAYRDETDITQQITFDNIEVGYFSELNVFAKRYDRTSNGMRERFKCLSDYAVANGIIGLPSAQEIETLITSLKNNDYYMHKGKIVNGGITQESMVEHRKALIRLVNFEGSNEDYCAKPVFADWYLP